MFNSTAVHLDRCVILPTVTMLSSGIIVTTCIQKYTANFSVEMSFICCKCLLFVVKLQCSFSYWCCVRYPPLTTEFKVLSGNIPSALGPSLSLPSFQWTTTPGAIYTCYSHKPCELLSDQLLLSTKKYCEETFREKVHHIWVNTGKQQLWWLKDFQKRKYLFVF